MQSVSLFISQHQVAEALKCVVVTLFLTVNWVVTLFTVRRAGARKVGVRKGPVISKESCDRFNFVDAYWNLRDTWTRRAAEHKILADKMRRRLTAYFESSGVQCKPHILGIQEERRLSTPTVLPTKQQKAELANRHQSTRSDVTHTQVCITSMASPARQPDRDSVSMQSDDSAAYIFAS